VSEGLAVACVEEIFVKLMGMYHGCCKKKYGIKLRVIQEKVLKKIMMKL